MTDESEDAYDRWMKYSNAKAGHHNDGNIIKVRCWIVRSTDKAYLFSKLPMSKSPTDADKVWIPRSLIEHITKQKAPDVLDIEYQECEVSLPEWVAEKNNLV
jgi:hypothetical protein